MSYILQTDHLGKTIDGKELVANVNIHIKKGKVEKKVRKYYL